MLNLTKVVTRILKRRKKDGVVSFFFFFFALFFHVMYFCVLQKRKQRSLSHPSYVCMYVCTCINICMHASVCVYGVLYSVCIVHT